MGKPRNTQKYPTYPEIPEIPERKKDTRKYPIVFFDTLTRPEPDPQPGILFNTRPDPTRYWKTLPAGHCLWPLVSNVLTCNHHIVHHHPSLQSSTNTKSPPTHCWSTTTIILRFTNGFSQQTLQGTLTILAKVLHCHTSLFMLDNKVVFRLSWEKVAVLHPRFIIKCLYRGTSPFHHTSLWNNPFGDC